MIQPRRSVHMSLDMPLFGIPGSTIAFYDLEGFKGVPLWGRLGNQGAQNDPRRSFPDLRGRIMAKQLPARSGTLSVLRSILESPNLVQEVRCLPIPVLGRAIESPS